MSVSVSESKSLKASLRAIKSARYCYIASTVGMSNPSTPTSMFYSCKYTHGPII